MKPIRTSSTPTHIRSLNLFLGALLMLVATLLLLALATWHATDPSWDTAEQLVAGQPLMHNWIGPVGAWTSDLLLQIFGISAFALPLWLGGLGLRWLRAIPGGPAWLRWTGVAMTLLSLPTAIAMIPWHWRWLHMLPVEGVLGRLLADPLIRWMSLRGAAIVAVVVAAAGLYLSSEFRFRRAWVFVQEQSIRVAALLDRWRNWRLDRADRRAALQFEHETSLRMTSNDLAEDEKRVESPSANGAAPLWTQPHGKSMGWLWRIFGRRQREELLDEVPAVRRIGDLAARRESAAARRSIWESASAHAVSMPRGAVAAEEVTQPVDLGPQTDAVVPITQRADEPDIPAPARQSAESASRTASSPVPVQPIAQRSTITPSTARTASEAPIHERADVDLRTAAVAPKNVSGFKLPPSTLLLKGEIPLAIRENELREEARKLVEKCAEFRVNGQIVQINPGPMVTTYEFKPDASVKYSRVAGLGDDLCLAMRAESILIERMAGKSTIGIQVPNHERETIHLRDVIESETFTKAKSRLALSMGKDINGRIVTADLASMPHVLIAGSTGSGKSVAINAMIMSLLFRTTPAQVRLILVDPKRVELGMYEGIPHLFTPIITEAKLAANALRNAVREMERRLKLLASRSVRNIDQYNAKVSERSMSSLFSDGEEESPLPYIVIIIDELADLMMLDRANVEESITRLAQMARAVGIHLVLATQRPSVDVITGLIKANVPTRISFRLASKVDSRTIIDDNGAESLLGRGDMLFRPPGTSRLMRLHAPYVSEHETAAVVDFWKAQGEAEYVEGFLEAPREERAREEGDGDSEEDNDPLFDDAVRLVFEFGKASTSLLQRRLRIGYGRAAHLIDLMEKDGLVGPADGSRPRELLKSPGWLHEIPTAID
jgi:S-DNA-T family DNA segregation ATPase FtsK/SpoIIIE